MARKFIHANNMPPKIGVLHFIVWWLALDRFGAPGWLYGALFTVLGIAYLIQLWTVFTFEAVDVLGNKGRSR